MRDSHTIRNMFDQLDQKEEAEVRVLFRLGKYTDDDAVIVESWLLEKERSREEKNTKSMRNAAWAAAFAALFSAIASFFSINAVNQFVLQIIGSLFCCR